MTTMTQSLAVSPVAWSQLSELDEELAALDDTDLECMREVRDVLLKYGKVDRFALELAHKNFEMEDDEILIEYTNPETREQFFRPEKWVNVPDAIPTSWILKDMEPAANTLSVVQGPNKGIIA
ncbi:MAG: hypothetical protein DI551_07170 [Micavibrio aeruginosavorus]|uniref:Uncharacterized protein n=1 Tax=Micavibrio aeruginosavorus TaxID=349221 RepID=A0A2W5MWA0_9BACT|nr:MAG: hypothetical protein DI551_07170 [Micavibrio aeruginosavorus]